MYQDGTPLRLTADQREVLSIFRRALQNDSFRLAFAEMAYKSLAASLIPDPIIPLQVVTKLLAVTPQRVNYWMTKLTIPRRYRISGREHTRRRMLFASEITELRHAMIRGEGRSHREVRAGIGGENL